jgi:molybdopterin synthase catalytic subunit
MGATGVVQVEVLLFARLRELVGRSSVSLSLSVSAGVDGGAHVPPCAAGDVWRELVGAHPRLAGADSGLRVAVNQSYADWSTPVADGDVVAFIPPVAGGSGAGSAVGRPGIHVWLTSSPLDPRAVEELVRTDEDGAVCTFVGVVRNHAEGHAVTHMDYEAYPGMAEAEMERIAADALARFGATAVAAVHRVGRLEVGEASVVVAASAPHRGVAFDACRYTIDTLKAEAPVWKKEYGPDGAEWVDERLRQH